MITADFDTIDIDYTICEFFPSWYERDVRVVDIRPIGPAGVWPQVFFSFPDQLIFEEFVKAYCEGDEDLMEVYLNPD